MESEVLDVVYQELRELAESSMRGWSSRHTLQPTALVHEAWLRLVDQKEIQFGGSSQFYCLASRIMRSVLLDHHRAKTRQKRGGGAAQVSLEVHEGEPDDAVAPLDIMALEEALSELEARDPDLCRIVELRFFGGLSHPEIARTIDVPLRTVERRWRRARAWLQAELDG